MLHELYPDVKCKLMYRRDIGNLAVKYGLFEDEMTGVDMDNDTNEKEN
jgi:hypothetical protein